MAGAWIPCPGAPTDIGNRKFWRGDHVGPLLYATGGEIPVPGAFGFPGFIEDIGATAGGYSYSNNYYVKIALPANSFNAAEQSAPTWGANASNANNTNQLQILWYYANNNNQVAANANLSAEGVRITAWGG